MGQMRAALHEAAPKVPVIDLFADAPIFDMRAASYLLAAYSSDMGEGAILGCVVDPGVGGERPPMILWAQNQVFVGLAMVCLKSWPAGTAPIRLAA